jgi:hypothetical protein
MEYTLQQVNPLSNQFILTASGIPSDKVAGIQDTLNTVLFGIEPEKPVVPSFFIIDAKGVEETARALYFAGRKIDAIKFVRRVTNWGLKDAKDFCDQMGDTTGVFPVARNGALDLKNFAISRNLRF